MQQSSMINFIDPNWDKIGGRIKIYSRIYRLITIKFKSPFCTEKAVMIAESIDDRNRAIFVPKSMSFVYEKYNGAGMYDYYIYVVESMFREKYLLMSKYKAIRDLKDIIDKKHKVLVALQGEAFSTPESKLKRINDEIREFYEYYECYFHYRDIYFKGI